MVAAVKSMECAAVPSSLKSLKVFDPEIVLLAVLAPRENHTLLNVLPPPPNEVVEFEVSVIFIVPVEAVIVAVAAMENTPLVPVSTCVADPKVRVLARVAKICPALII